MGDDEGVSGSDPPLAEDSLFDTGVSDPASNLKLSCVVLIVDVRRELARVYQELVDRFSANP